MSGKLRPVSSGLSVTASCGGEDSADIETGAAVRGVTDTEIVIGTQNDLSGPAGLLGADAVNGARLRFEEINEAGGIHGQAALAHATHTKCTG